MSQLPGTAKRGEPGTGGSSHTHRGGLGHILLDAANPADGRACVPRVKAPAASPWERARTPEQCGYWSRTSPQPLLCPGLPRAQAGWEDWEDFQGPGRPCRSGSLGASRRERETRHSCVGEGPDEGIVRDSGATGILRAGHLKSTLHGRVPALQWRLCSPRLSLESPLTLAQMVLSLPSPSLRPG